MATCATLIALPERRREQRTIFMFYCGVEGFLGDLENVSRWAKSEQAGSILDALTRIYEPKEPL